MFATAAAAAWQRQYLAALAATGQWTGPALSPETTALAETMTAAEAEAVLAV